MQSKFQIDAFLPWEVGLIVILIGLILIFIGNKQSKKKNNDLNDLPWTKPTTKIIFGASFLVIGLVQLFPLLKLL